MTTSPTTSPLPRSLGEGLVGRSLASPVGTLELVASPVGLRAVLWPGEDGSRVARSLITHRPDTGSHAGMAPAHPVDSRDGRDRVQAVTHLDRAQIQLAQYFDGSRRDFDLDLDPQGTPFQLRVWQVLRAIPYGTTRSYRQAAEALGDAAAARPVGAATGRNPVSIIVACHRVVAATGSLTGFAGGLPTKAWLLEHERRVLAGEPSAPRLRR